MVTDRTVEISVTMSNARTIEEIATKLATDPNAMAMPLETYSLASIAFGLLGTNTCRCLVQRSRILFALMNFSLFRQFFFACSLNRTRMDTLPTAVDPFIRAQRIHPSTVVGKKRPTSP